LKISLRKAHLLQTELQALISGVRINSSVNISEFENPEGVLMQAREEALTNIDVKKHLITVLTEIRQLVNDANNNTDETLLPISDQLAHIVKYQKAIAIYETLLKEVRAIEALEIIEGRLSKLRGATSSNEYGQSNSVAAYVFSKEDVESFKDQLATMKREKARIQDMLLEANISTTIELSERICDQLRKHRLL